MRRREFITLLSGAAAGWPLVARAQQPGRTRLIGVLTSYTQQDPEAQKRLTAFREGLQNLGWAEGRNVRIEYRWGTNDAARVRARATELVALSPDVILANGTPLTLALQRETRTIPIVFVNATDPVESGLVSSLARPGGNTTGFANYEYPIGGKWVEILKEIVPRIARVLVIINPANRSSAGLLRTIEEVARTSGVQVRAAEVSDRGAIERAIDAFAHAPDGGIVHLPDATNSRHRQLIFALAAQHRLPAIYPFGYFAAEGGLVSYGVDGPDIFRRAALYADRILKGEKPADLPVQAPTRYELVINLKTAKALGLEVPPMLLARADEVIE